MLLFCLPGLQTPEEVTRSSEEVTRSSEEVPQSIFGSSRPRTRPAPAPGPGAGGALSSQSSAEQLLCSTVCASSFNGTMMGGGTRAGTGAGTRALLLLLLCSLCSGHSSYGSGLQPQTGPDPVQVQGSHRDRSSIVRGTRFDAQMVPESEPVQAEPRTAQVRRHGAVSLSSSPGRFWLWFWFWCLSRVRLICQSVQNQC